MARPSTFRPKKKLRTRFANAAKKTAIGATVLVGSVAAFGAGGYYQFGTSQTKLVEHVSVNPTENWNEKEGAWVTTYEISANGEKLKDQSSFVHLKFGDNKIAPKLEDGEAYLVTTYGGFGPFTPNITKAQKLTEEQVQNYKEAHKPKPKPGTGKPGTGSTQPSGLASVQAAADLLSADAAKLKADGTKLSEAGKNMGDTVKKLQKEADKLSVTSGKISEVGSSMSELAYTLSYLASEGTYDADTGEYIEGDSTEIDQLIEDLNKLITSTDATTEKIDKIKTDLAKLATSATQMSKDGAQMVTDGTKLQADAVKIAATKPAPRPALSGKKSVCTITFNGKVHKITVPSEAVGKTAVDTKPATTLSATNCKPVPPPAPKTPAAT